jgi:predicted HTH domain antitoxin
LWTFQSTKRKENRGNDFMRQSIVREIMGVLGEEYHLDVQEIQVEALSLYLNANPALKLNGAVALWRRGRISLAKAAEISGITVPEFKEVLAARGIVRETEGKTARVMDKKLRKLFS